MKPKLTLMVVLLIALVLLGGAAQARAALPVLLKVNSLVDKPAFNPASGVCQTKATNKVCTLRAAVQVANAAVGPVTIVVPAGIYKLTLVGAGEDNAATGDLDLLGSVTITGAGQVYTFIDGNKTDRVFQVLNGANATIQKLTIRNGNPGADVGGGIKVDAGGTLTLNNALVTLGKATSGGGIYSQGTVSLSNSRVNGNNAGGIRNQGGTLTLTNTNVLSNLGDYGVYNLQGQLSVTGGAVNQNAGGIYNQDTSCPSGAALTGVKIKNNSGSGVYNFSSAAASCLSIAGAVLLGNHVTTVGGGIYNSGPGASITVTKTKIQQNGATLGGGGIYNVGSMVVDHTAIVYNHADDGAGLNAAEGGTITLTNVTISNNLSGGNGGGVTAGGTATLNNVTLNGNMAQNGAALYADSGTISLLNTIVAGSNPALNCGTNTGVITSSGHNIDSGSSCGLAGVGDFSSVNPKLNLLANYGGGTLTNALLKGSPAIDNGDQGFCTINVLDDQRGAPRPVDGNHDGVAVCDIGAFEYGSIVPLAPAP